MSVTQSARIGGALDLTAISNARTSLRDASPMHAFKNDADRHFVFEGLHDTAQAAKDLAELWVTDVNNLSRVYGYFRREVPHHDDHLNFFGAIRIKETGRTVHLEKGIREEHGIWVFIPLDTWTTQNGLWTEGTVEVGQDLTIDGLEPITFNGAGGCVLVAICLK
ncbi:hypothetical protein KVT40_007111 [Elsinoe batatas]|uniref:Uncharacterized protein n=1 Tax=Elsinoe batatas TaxID=2601811 RepID=A0A8K0L0S1_9PEZI|nr:hypothetical protein KVT40_007111 [Elsinoe batatas]